ncbi:hypothetical protein MNBD_GAMMA22-1922 [hydrothermal vent metagenome]|uniref:Uncharacterized protein n=1 Tax=hydrothermal vent metagenome TaxID=652676 RepID=A0A3B1A2B6_9ZZZZ
MKKVIRDVVDFLTTNNADPTHVSEPNFESGLVTFKSEIGTTCDLGIQNIAITPGASSTCGGGNCSCSSCCSW